MSHRIDHWPTAERLGPVVVSIGVFDGVHVGHRALLSAAVGDARARSVPSVALTFDTDPQRVLDPDAAPPELLTFHERTEALLETGVDHVVVVPFTPELAAMEPEAFLDTVLARCCTPLAIHVGEDFRFGARASGDIATLHAWGAEHDASVRAHPTVRVGGEPVSATRIRRLIAEGDVRAAGALMLRPPRLHGTVEHGRGEGRGIGFATANLTPHPGSAVPADGVYAGRATLADGSQWPTAISIGVPPSFPEASDTIEAHLIGYDGDLYGSELTLEFLERLRDLVRFETLHELRHAIADDLDRTRAIVRAAESAPLVDDPLVLEAAEIAAASAPHPSQYRRLTDAEAQTWVTVFGPAKVSALFLDGGVSGALVAGPLADAGIPFAWLPFPPELAQTARPDLNWQREFRLLVPPEHAEAAREIIRRLLR